jgi:hypothetical protein
MLATRTLDGVDGWLVSLFKVMQKSFLGSQLNGILIQSQNRNKLDELLAADSINNFPAGREG